jgi:hypothetical protein
MPVQAHVKQYGRVAGSDQVRDARLTGEVVPGGLPIYERQDGEPFYRSYILELGIVGGGPHPVGSPATEIESDDHRCHDGRQ